MYIETYPEHMDWDDACSEAKEELGYSKGEYINDFNAVVELAKNILYEYNEEKREEASNDAVFDHRQWIKSDEWKRKSKEVIIRDKGLCRKCGLQATEVHHSNYDYMRTDEEIKHCIALCRSCHKIVHNIL